MNKILTLSLFLIVSINSFAQQSSYYALDGSEWRAEDQRNLKEDQLWNTLNQNFAKMYKLEPDSDKGIANEILGIREAISGIRNANTGLNSLFTSGVIDLNQLKNKGVAINSAYASNGEEFALEEVRDAFDIAIDFYTYIHNLTSSIDNIDPDYPIDYKFIASKIQEKLQLLMDNLDTALERFNTKALAITNAISSTEEDLNE